MLLSPFQDKFFGGEKNAHMPMPMALPDSDNPKANVFTSLDSYEKYYPGNAYSSETGQYFWGKNPRKGDEFFVIFDSPEKLKRITIETGHPFQKNDYLRNGVVEVSPTLLSAPSAGHSGRCNCTNYISLGEFAQGRLDATNLKDTVTFPVKCLRIRVTANQDEWVIIYHIAVYVLKQEELKSVVSVPPK